ncbi:translation initiation factor IF-3 [Candidatus Photodesmus katoptron]|uniref:Translation initiation factor IF-3 n=1 Tax=Candidatus Photodesmus katoptron Akat1 TaxID=1236703 RepID=S3EHD7_9GAMM|nr:translation initiation factor IF-3 [Candidatus Photodesmus katoptron]EPE37598.1 translation initiation factor IF-3 [Candidatus Photodesmus katoptron Akat1]KEY90684.1 translation initiation factor IF-3 [Candidatus Photodesmus katoptron]
MAKQQDQHRLNDEISGVKEVRLIGINSQPMGIISFNKALEMALEVGIDLVEISPNAEPPVCRIMDYGKFLFEKNKAAKEQKRKQKQIQVKEIKFRPGTDIGDYHVKLRNLLRFLKDGNKVKITVRFRGREMAHQNIGINVLNRLKRDTEKLAIVESFPNKIEARQMVMLLSPKKK